MDQQAPNGVPNHPTIENQQLYGLTIPFTIYSKNIIASSDPPIHWLWPDRLPLGGITLLDGDYNTDLSLLALIIAVCTSSGIPLLGDSLAILGGVVIISPNVDARLAQIPFLVSQGANLAQIEILSYVHDPEHATHPSGYRPFQLPLDLPRLLEAIERVNAKLIILDSFIDLLSHDRRWTDQRLADLLEELNQYLIARHIACLITRHCPARGGLARPSVLERSQRFQRIALSHLLVALDPLQPANLLLSHVKTFPDTKLAPTLTLHIQKRSPSSPQPCVTTLGTHDLQASDFLSHRPEALHRRLLFQHLLDLISATTTPIHVSKLYTQSPHSSSSQIQRTLRDLLNMGQIEHPARGFYAPTPADPVFLPKASEERGTSVEDILEQVLQEIIAHENEEKQESTIITDEEGAFFDTDNTMLTPKPQPNFNSSGATTFEHDPDRELASSGATTLVRESDHDLAQSGPTTSTHEADRELAQPDATPSKPAPIPELNATGATTLNHPPTNDLIEYAAIPSGDPLIDRNQKIAAVLSDPVFINRLKECAATSGAPSFVEKLQKIITVLSNPSLTNGPREVAATLTGYTLMYAILAVAAREPKSLLNKMCQEISTFITAPSPTPRLQEIATILFDSSVTNSTH